MHCDRHRRRDAKANLIAVDLHHLDRNVRPDPQDLTDSASQYQHLTHPPTVIESAAIMTGRPEATAIFYHPSAACPPDLSALASTQHAGPGAPRPDRAAAPLLPSRGGGAPRVDKLRLHPLQSLARCAPASVFHHGAARGISGVNPRALSAR